MSRAPSLRARLLAGVLLAVALAWIGISVAGWMRARREVEELFDAHLAQAAAVLVALLSDEDGELEIEMEHAPELHRYARNVAFQVWERGRKLRVHSRNAPRSRLSDVETGFADAVVDGERWRVFSTWALERRALVQVGERVDARESVASQIARHLLVPLVVALPLLAIALFVAVGRSLEPLRALADALASRDAGRLEPVAVARAPREVRPLVDRLNQLFARIDALLERERAFTADAAHELRTPLAAIRAQAQVAWAATDDAERRRALDSVLAGCDRAARLSEQLLTLARVDDAGSRRSFARCDLAAIAREVLAEIAQLAHSRGVAVELDGESHVAVLADPALLHVLLRNLVDNAIRYAPPASRVRVEVAARSPSALLRVIDEGPGIPESERERVLDRFYRGRGASRPGAGLGLSIVARIAALHEAALALGTGDGGRGLVVTIAFPLAREPAPEATGAATPGPVSRP